MNITFVSDEWIMPWVIQEYIAVPVEWVKYIISSCEPSEYWVCFEWLPHLSAEWVMPWVMQGYIAVPVESLKYMYISSGESSEHSQVLTGLFTPEQCELTLLAAHSTQLTSGCMVITPMQLLTQGFYHTLAHSASSLNSSSTMVYQVIGPTIVYQVFCVTYNRLKSTI